VKTIVAGTRGRRRPKTRWIDGIDGTRIVGVCVCERAVGDGTLGTCTGSRTVASVRRTNIRRVHIIQYANVVIITGICGE